MGTSAIAFVLLLAAGASARPLLPGDKDVIVKDWPFDADAQGWAPLNNLAPFTVADGVLRTQATGDDAHMGVNVSGVDCSEVSHLVVRMRSNQPGTTQVYFTTSEHPDPADNGVPAFAVSGDNEFRVYEVAMAGQRGWSGRLGLLRLDPVNGSGTSATIEIDYVRLIRKAPRLQLVRFAPDRVWVKPGEEVRLNLVVCDTTRGPELPNIEAQFAPGAQALPMAFADGAYSASVTIKPVALVTRCGVSVWVGGRSVLAATTAVIAIDFADLPVPVDEAGTQETPLGPAIGNSTASLLLVDLGGTQSAILRAREAGSGRWLVAGVCSPLITVAARTAIGDYFSTPLLAVEERSRNRLILIGRPDWQAPDRGPEASVSLELSVDPRRPAIQVRSSLKPGSPLSLLRFSGPALLAGEGAFGASKQCALFPGIEFLEGDQRSSDPVPVGDRLGYRPVPPPYQITVPVMAVEGGGVLCGRMCDALQKWDGRNDMPLGEFASPNFLDEQANHLMATFVPSYPEWTAPNSRAAQTPCELSSGAEIVLDERLFAVAGGRITDAVPLWYETYGRPAPPRLAKSPEATLEDLIEGWATTCYYPELDKFVNHWRVGQEPFASPGLKATILTDYLQTGNERWIERCKIDPHTRYIDLLGSLFDGFAEGGPPSSIASQRPDGTWPYECSPEQAKRVEEFTGGQRHDLGQPGSTSVGLIAVQAGGILAHALSTGNADSEAAGLKALEAMARFRVPAGAQTWEVHKDIADIYATALTVNCFRMGYELTGERRWLDQAVYWAYTGLPFLYAYQVPGTGPGATVNIPGDPRTEGDDELQGSHPSSVVFADPDRHLTPYASIPVFGTSFYVVSWFGNVVQWCGLVWADSVYDLLDYVDDPVLKAAADSVVYSGCQQTFDRSPVVGLLPDTWHLGNNMIHPAFIGPSRVEAPLRKLLNRPSFSGTQTAVVHGPGKRAHVTSRAVVSAARLTKSRLTFTLAYLPGQISETVIMGLPEPRSVRVDGESLPRAANLEQADRGWRYVATPGRIDIRAQHANKPVEVVISLR
jgi:hypothetical protein